MKMDGLWLLPLLPGLGGFLLLVGGHRLDRIAGPLSVLLAILATLLSVLAWAHRTDAVLRWLPQGATALPLSLSSRGPNAPMALLISALTVAILFYAREYMERDRARARFFGLMSGFLGSMLGLVLADDLLTLLLFWEGVGICSYALIAFWYADSTKPPAALRAFLSTRFADLGLYVAAMASFAGTGGFSFAALPGLRGASLNLVVAGLILAAVGKSAQWPFSGWLAGAMQGPTPVSALLHSATMVAAGAFLLLKLLPLLTMTSWALPVLLWIGTVSLLTGAVLALYQTDLKQILAASTVSQFGYVFAALGAGSGGAAALHLLNHAVFKAALFLATGVLARQGLRTLSDMGGLRRTLPWTAAAFLLGALALAAFPPFGAFFSKDFMLAALWQASIPAGVLGLVGVLLSAAYAGRAYFAAFAGVPSTRQAPRARRGGMRYTPLFLGMLALVLGLLALPAWRSGLPAALGTAPVSPGPLWLAGWATGLSALGWLWSAVLQRRRARVLPGAWQVRAEHWFGLVSFLDAVGRLTLRWGRALMRLEQRVLDSGAPPPAAGPVLVDRFPGAARALARLSALLDRRLWDGLLAALTRVLQAGARTLNGLQNGLLHRYYAWLSIAAALLFLLSLWQAGR